MICKTAWVLRVYLGLGVLVPTVALASPWAEVGDTQQRSDMELLAGAGVIDSMTMQWPIPWAGVTTRLNAPNALAGQPDAILAAADRIEKAAQADTEDGIQYSFDLDATNSPAVVRGFDALGRQDVQSQGVVQWNGSTTSVRLAVGAETTNRYDHQALLLDGSYIAQRIGSVELYGGYLTHWWGPGWSSALSLSNNARPFPQVGITRADTNALDMPVLSWLGPWQFDFFVGWLDGKRTAENTLVDGLRLNFNPLPGLEIGLARLDELCGEGHPCKPIATYFDLQNNDGHPSRTNDEGNIDIKYTTSVWGQNFSIYTQLMNEDSSPFVHSGTSHLFGVTSWLPLDQTLARITAEYTDSIATRNIFSFGDDIYGFSYNDVKYTDGMRYRDRTLGFSLDDDSRLASFQASWLGADAIEYELTYDRAMIGSPLSPGANVVSTAPVTIDIAEARANIPWKQFKISLALRLQDGQPQPDHGDVAAFEVAASYHY